MMKEILNQLKEKDNFRTLSTIHTAQNYIISDKKQYLNLSSNDYLGLSETALQKSFFEHLDLNGEFLMSNPSSRLMTGNTHYYQQLETSISNLFGKESALVLSSGFLINTGVLAAITLPDDLIIADKKVHASIIDGLKLCSCKWERFKHNDMNHLRKLLEQNRGKFKNVYVVTESIFSMDGDTAYLKEIVALKKEFGFSIYLDEAHAFGVRGEQGCGVAEELGLLQDIDFMVATMGKAVCSAGAFVVCNYFFREVLINKMRPLIYSTAMPPISLLWSKFIIDKLPDMSNKREKLTKLSTYLSTLLKRDVDNFHTISHIVPIIIGDNALTLKISNELKEQGFWVTAIRHPTVAQGSARLRVSLHSSLSVSEIDSFYDSLSTILTNNGITQYNQE